MGTRSSIAIKKDDKIVSIYCHWDGYPKGVGEDLKLHWNTEEKIDELMKLGDLSTLGSEIGEKQDFDSPRAGWCLSYGRDRGEPNTQAKEHFSIRGWIDYRAKSGCEYMYLFEDGVWNIFSN